MATGNDILSYGGDAALAAGASGGVGGFDGNAAVQIGENAGALMKTAMQYQLAWNTMKYQQAIKDRDDTYNLFATASNEVDANGDFPVLPEDRKAIDERIEGLKSKMIANPNLKANKQAWLEVQKDTQALTAMKASAKSRYLERAKLFKTASEELNPDRKRRILEHLDTQVKKGVESPIDPYNELVQWNDKTFPTPTAENGGILMSYERYKDPTTGIEMKRPVSSVSPDFYAKHLDFAAVVRGEKNNLPHEIKNFYEQQVQNPDVMNPDSFKRINATVDAFNIANKLTPDSDKWVRHIGDVDGDKVSANTSPIEFAKAFWVADTFKTATAGAAVPDKEMQEGIKTKAETTKIKQEGTAAIMNAQAHKVQAAGSAAKDYASAALDKIKGEGEKYELGLLKTTAHQEAKDAINIFATEADKKDGYKPAVTGMTAVLGKEATDKAVAKLGIDDTWTATDLGRGTTTMRKALAVMQDVKYGGGNKKNAFGQNEVVPDDKIAKIINQPTRVIMLKSPDGDPDKMRLVGFDKDGGILSSADMNEAGLNMIREGSGFKPDANFDKKTRAYRKVVQDLQGSEAPGFSLKAIMNKATYSSTNIAPVQRGELPNLPKLGSTEYRVKEDVAYDPTSGQPVARKVDGKWVNLD